jgi:hypothetical protein
MALSDIEKNKQVTIYMKQVAAPDSLEKIKTILEKNPGNAQVFVAIGSGATEKKVKAKSLVRISQSLFEELRKIPDIAQVKGS